MIKDILAGVFWFLLIGILVLYAIGDGTPCAELTFLLAGNSPFVSKTKCGAERILAEFLPNPWLQPSNQK
jgi:hypothetical protein